MCPVIELPQNSEFFNVGHGKVGFSDDQLNRLRRAFDKINSSACADWLHSTLQSLRGREDLNGTGTRPTTVQGLETMASLNRYDPNNSASQMGITQAEKNAMDKEGADAVTFGSPDSQGRPFTRVFLRGRAFDQSGHFYYAYYDARDLSGIIVYEFFHVAGFSDAAARPFIHQIQLHCGNPSSVL